LENTHTPLKAGKQIRIAVRARNISISIIVLILFLIAILAFMVLREINDDVSSEIARSYSIEAAEKFYSYISQDLILVQKVSLSKVVTEWFADQYDQEKRISAYYEMMEYAGMLKRENLYFGINDSLDEYSIGSEASFEDFEPFDWLDPTVEYNNWYFNCIASENDYSLNVDIDKVSNEWTLWINHKVMKDNKIVGVFCSGLQFNEILHSMFDNFRGSENIAYVIDKKGNILMDSSFSEEYSDAAIFDVGNDEFAAAARLYLGQINGHFGRQTTPDVIKLSHGATSYASIAPIQASDWSVVVFISNSNLTGFDNITRTLPLLIALLFALLLYVIVQNALMNKLIFKPIQSLTESVLNTKSSSVDIFGIDRNDEIGKLARSAGEALRKANEASNAKSNFLSSMSHEIRTPMNAIIGMTQIAAKTNDVDKLKYCLTNIENSSSHLLGLLNDILDMSKIEAGKFELEHAQMSIEKMLIKVCGLITGKVEQKDIQFNITLGANMRMHYIGDELRLAQVITNLLSNAVKFTPVGGKIDLSVKETELEDKYSILRFSVKDNGIGMTDDQIGKLFGAFEQAESGTTRKYGGTGLGLAISKSIIEKMNGRIWVNSVPDYGSEFTFEVRLERRDHEKDSIVFGSIRASDIKILISDPDTEARENLKSILESFGMKADETDNVVEAVDLATKAREIGKPYDVVFVDYVLANEKGVWFINNSEFTINKNNVVVMTTFLNWTAIAETLRGIGVNRFVPKPLFPSSIMDIITEIIGEQARSIEITSEKTVSAPDLSDITLLLAEDVEINREIFFALLEETKINVEAAENGLIAVEKFKEDPNKYSIIIMDIQMPEMDGYDATISIRSLDNERAKTIPIVAMTANAFKEDIEKCLDCGMNDHLSKPIELNTVMEKILYYSRQWNAHG